MAVQFSAGFAALVTGAFDSGVETSLEQLGVLLDLAQDDPLTVTPQVMDAIARFDLELVPGPSVGEFDSVRVLRRSLVNTDLGVMTQLISKGEGPKIEFKSSLVCSMYHWRTQGKLVELPALPGEVLKSICALLNSEGGDVMIGVEDSGTPCDGIARDLELKGWSLDDWQLHFATLIESRFFNGRLVPPYLRTQFVEIGNDSVFRVQVSPRESRSFVQREKGKPYEFFVRNGSRSDSLELPEFYEHVLARSI